MQSSVVRRIGSCYGVLHPIASLLGEDCLCCEALAVSGLCSSKHAWPAAELLGLSVLAGQTATLSRHRTQSGSATNSDSSCLTVSNPIEHARSHNARFVEYCPCPPFTNMTRTRCARRRRMLSTEEGSHTARAGHRLGGSPQNPAGNAGSRSCRLCRERRRERRTYPPA
jgi:hypothetical protein